MNIYDAKIGVRVSHPKFNKGTITQVQDMIVTVTFDEEFEGKKERKFNPDYLTLIHDDVAFKKTSTATSTNNQESTKNTATKFKVGDNVVHKEYGEGIVIEKRGFFRCLVEFKKTNEKILVLDNALTMVEVNIIDDDELLDDDISSAFKIVPSNYGDQSCYSTEAKRLLTYLRRKYTEDGIATIKSYTENDGQIGVLIVPNRGIIIYNLVSTDYSFEAIKSPMFEILFKNRYEQLKKYYMDAFLQSKTLCKFVNNSYKIMKYPVRFVYIFQNIDISKMSAEERTKIAVSNRDLYFKNFTTHIANNDLFSNFEKYDSNFVKINKSVYGSIIERVVPENATLISIAPTEKKISVNVCNNPEFTPITGKEREFSALYLDDTQIKTINDTKPGHYLTLANPGTGKSVLLVSKAYRIQSIKKDNHVLITCYNNNLAEHHNIFADVSGMKTQNLHISTFHKFAIDIVKKIDLYFFQTHKLDEENNFDLLVDRFDELINANKVSTKLNAIFIDEIQLFEPKWIDICYKLLDKTSGKDYFFEMFGDINQDVKSQRSKGKASWKNTKLIPSLQGRVRILDKNYRNTDIIANYLKCMILEFNTYLNQHGIPIDPDNACLTSETMRKGSLRVKILLASNKTNDVSKIGKTIDELVKKKQAEYNEIAIIYPAKGLGKYYTPLYHIQNELDSKDIPYSLIHGRDKRQRLYECDGVILSTIDSCLGLDFKYVIVCGMHYWDQIIESEKKFVKLDKKKLLFDKNAQLYLSEVGKKIYSACSRAREGLYIIDDLDSESPIKEIFRPKSGRRYYDEY